jgi:thymidylate synthase (FAD)
MYLMKPDVALEWVTPHALQMIERAGRTCYKSEDKITSTSAMKFVQLLLDKGHEAMIEHAGMSMRFICDRGVSHEFVRHRLFSYAQESTRYCNYGEQEHVKFIIPCWEDVPEGFCCMTEHPEIGKIIDSPKDAWLYAMQDAEIWYLGLLKDGWQAQQARSVLPNSVKTELVATGNMREWIHFFKMRCHKKAHPQMIQVANMALPIAQKWVPIIFDKFKLVEHPLIKYV